MKIGSSSKKLARVPAQMLRTWAAGRTPEAAKGSTLTPGEVIEVQRGTAVKPISLPLGGTQRQRVQ